MVKHVAKLVIVDNDDRYLLLYRAEHPTFGNDPDIPGGTVEGDESTLQTMIREVEEETGIIIEEDEAKQVYEGMDYSGEFEQYSLYTAKLDGRPDVKISWEHGLYQWITRADFLEKAKSAQDTYMHMVYDVLK